MNKENNAELHKIELNNMGDYIDISTTDTDLFDYFVAGYLRIADMAEGLPQKYKEIKQRYERPCVEKTVEIARANVGFSEAAIKIIDDTLGKDTIKKYFNKLYKEIPDFMPGTECFIDFYDNIAPILEELLRRRVGDSEKERIRSMGQYVYFGRQASGGNKVVPNRRKRYGKNH